MHGSGHYDCSLSPEGHSGQITPSRILAFRHNCLDTFLPIHNFASPLTSFCKFAVLQKCSKKIKNVEEI